MTIEEDFLARNLRMDIPDSKGMICRDKLADPASSLAP